MITADMIDAVRVQFIRPIFEDDFVERGMQAWLTGVEWCERSKCYELFFDFTEFEAVNAKYFRETYYPNARTARLGVDKSKYTAQEAGQYSPKYSVNFSVGREEVRDDMGFVLAIQDYLREVE